MNREKLDSWCERGILGLVLAVLVFGPLATGAVGTLEFLVIQGLSLGVMLLWGLRLWLMPRPRLLWPPVCWAVVAFSLYVLGRYLTADIEYIARQELVRVLLYGFLFLAIVNNLHRQDSTQFISFSLVFLALAISGYALFQFLTKSDYVWHFIKPYPNRGSGTYICPNHLAGFLELLLPLALSYTLVGRGKAVTRILLGYGALVMMVGIGVSFSRGGWIASGISLVLLLGVLLSHRTYRLPALAGLLALAVGALLLYPKSMPLQNRFHRAFSADGRLDDSMRFALWVPAVHMWQDNLWWGVGPAHFDTRFRQYRPDMVQLSPDHAHNDYLETLSDYGVAGGLLVGLGLLLLGLGTLKTWRFVRPSSAELGAKRGSNKFAFVLGSSLGLVALMCHSLLDFNMHVPANALLAVALMALLSSHVRFATERYWLRLGLSLKLLASAVLLAGLLFLGQQGWRHAREFVWLERAQQASHASMEQIRLLQKAFEAEPKNAQTALAIAQAFRRQSQEGASFYEGQEGADYQSLAQDSLNWFQRASRLDPWDPYSQLGCGWCLDWLKRFEQATPYFARAEQLDPNGFYTLNCIGLHYMEAGRFASARPWFERSSHLKWKDNPIAQNYLQLANARLLEGATNEVSARLNLTLTPP